MRKTEAIIVEVGTSRGALQVGEWRPGHLRKGSGHHMLIVCGILLSSLLFLVPAVVAQQALTAPQQCENLRQELVLADIAHQEARSRCANIIRQAVELEAQVKKLEGEKRQLQDEVAKAKEASDAAKTAE